MKTKCHCDAVGAGVQTFRIRQPVELFEVIATLDPMCEKFLGGRAIWKCRACGQHFAWMRLPY